MSCINREGNIGSSQKSYRPREGYELHQELTIITSQIISYRPREGYELHHFWKLKVLILQKVIVPVRGMSCIIIFAPPHCSREERYRPREGYELHQ